MDFLTTMYIICQIVVTIAAVYAVTMIVLGALAECGCKKAQIAYDFLAYEYDED